MATVRKLFNTSRDHEQSGEDLVLALDTASHAAGYELPEYAMTLESMIGSLTERLALVREEIGE